MRRDESSRRASRPPRPALPLPARSAIAIAYSLLVLAIAFPPPSEPIRVRGVRQFSRGL